MTLQKRERREAEYVCWRVNIEFIRIRKEKDDRVRYEQKKNYNYY